MKHHALEMSLIGFHAVFLPHDYEGKAIRTMDDLAAATAAAQTQGKPAVKVVVASGGNAKTPVCNPGRLGIRLTEL